jgi:hypothetical protein
MPILQDFKIYEFEASVNIYAAQKFATQGVPHALTFCLWYCYLLQNIKVMIAYFDLLIKKLYIL